MVCSLLYIHMNHGIHQCPDSRGARNDLFDRDYFTLVPTVTTGWQEDAEEGRSSTTKRSRDPHLAGGEQLVKYDRYV